MGMVNGIFSTVRENKWKSLAIALIVFLYISRKRNQAIQQHYQSLQKELSTLNYFKDAQLKSDLVVESLFFEIESKLKDYSKMKKTWQSFKSLQLTKSEKGLLWEKLKLASFVQLMGTVSITTFLFLLFRVETNMVGHYILQSSKSSKGVVYDITTQYVQENYSQAGFLRTIGLQALLKFIKEKIKHIVSEVSLRTDCSLKDTQQILFNIKKELITAIFDEKKLATLLLPKEKENRVLESRNEREEDLVQQFFAGNFSGSCKPGTIGDNVVLDLLHNETRNRVESVHFEKITQFCFNQAFEILQNSIATLYKEKNFEQVPIGTLLPHLSNLGDVTLMKHITLALSKLPLVQALSEDIMNLWEINQIS